jgi:hypothetical protein
MTGSCEYYNEPQASIQDGDFFDQLMQQYFLSKDAVPWSRPVLSNFTCLKAFIRKLGSTFPITPNFATLFCILNIK